MSEQRSSRPMVLGALTVVIAFAAGLGTGALLFGDDAGAVQRRAPAPPLFADLNLTSDQQARIDSILEQTERGTDSILDATRSQLAERATRARRAVEEVLTPEQAATLEERVRMLGPRMVRRVQVNDSVVRVDTIQ